MYSSQTLHVFHLDTAIGAINTHKPFRQAAMYICMYFKTNCLKPCLAHDIWQVLQVFKAFRLSLRCKTRVRAEHRVSLCVHEWNTYCMPTEEFLTDLAREEEVADKFAQVYNLWTSVSVLVEITIWFSFFYSLLTVFKLHSQFPRLTPARWLLLVAVVRKNSPYCHTSSRRAMPLELLLQTKLQPLSG